MENEATLKPSKKEIITQLKAELEALSKELESVKTSRTYANDRTLRVEKELNEAHDLIDTLTKTETNHYSERKSLSNRLASFIYTELKK